MRWTDWLNRWRGTGGFRRTTCHKRWRTGVEHLEHRCLLTAGAEGATSSLVENYGQIPLSFEANVGQTDSQVKFLTHGTGYAVFLTDQAAVISLPRADYATSRISDVVRLQLLGSNPAPHITGVGEQSHRSNYFVGSNPADWRTDITNFSRVRFEEAYPGIDVVYYGKQRQLEYDFLVAPGADPSAIRMSFTGQTGLAVNEAGQLVLQTGGGPIYQDAPVLYQDIDGVRHAVDGGYVAGTGGEVSFEIGDYDRSQPLVIDPVLVYSGSSTFSGSGDERAFAIATDAAGNAYVTGESASTDFPATIGAVQETSGGGYDAVVAKIDSAGTQFLYSTYLGDAGDEAGYAIAVDATGNAYVTGTTGSQSFPTTPGALQTAPPGSLDTNGFVTKLNPTGSALVFSTYLGGTGNDIARGIALASTGDVFVTGQTSSSEFPVLGAIQGTIDGTVDLFVTRLNSDGSSLDFSTYYGGTSVSGTSTEVGTSIAVDPADNVYVAGTTDATDFPTNTGAFQEAGDAELGGNNAFVLKLNQVGALGYATLLGGLADEKAFGIAVDIHGNAVIVGSTTSTNFPFSGDKLDEFNQGATNGSSDAFVTLLQAGGAQVAFSTYLGSTLNDAANAVALDSAGRIYITGFTNDSDNFPMVNAIQDHGGNNATGLPDGFVSVIDPSVPALVFSSYLNGTNSDLGYGITVDTAGNVYVAGETKSGDFPTASGSVPGGPPGTDSNAFVVKISMGSINAPNTIEGDVYLDTNSNGARDVNESFRTGHVVYLDTNNNGQLNTGESQQSTNANGHYAFTGLAAGQYMVRAVLPADSSGFAETSPSRHSYMVTLAAGQNLNGLDFGLEQIPAASRVLKIGEYRSLAGTSITVPLDLSDGTGVKSIDLVLRYDTTILDTSDLGVNLGTLTAGWTINSRVDDVAGEVAITLSNAVPLAGGSGSVATIDFRVAFDGYPSGAVSPLRIASLALLDGGGNSLPSFRQSGTFQGYGFVVEAFQPTDSGFSLELNHDKAKGALSLYRGQASGAAPDVRVVDANGNPVLGSIAWDPDEHILTFVKSGGELDSGVNYTVTLVSGVGGVVDASGEQLDGDANGTPGGNYVTTFMKPNAGAAPSIGLPDFAGGPGQSLAILQSGAGVPVTISDGNGVSGVDIELNFDPVMLGISGMSIAAGMPADWQIFTTDITVPGRIRITAGGTALPAGARNLFMLGGGVPNDAPYTSSQLLSWGQIQLNGGAIGGTGDSAVHCVAYFGDSSGNGGYSALDASFIARVAVGLDTGFDAFELTDPRIIGDLNHDGSFTPSDALGTLRQSVGIAQPTIPPLPGVMTPLTPGGVDPIVTVTSMTVLKGDSFVAPLTIDATPGLQAFNLDIAFNPAVFTAGPTTVALGSLLPAGWQFEQNMQVSAGRLRVGAFNTTLLNAGAGELVRIGLKANTGAPSGPSQVQLIDNVDNIGRNALNEGRLTLTTVPGTITVNTPAPDLKVSMSQTGTFKQRDVGDRYTIIVRNTGTLPTNGSTVTLINTLPAGLTATAFTGTGWTVNLATLTATRSDVLAAGASYPALTLTVNVSPTAPASVTNSARVSGGGELVTNNNVGSNLTTILPVTITGNLVITGPAVPFTSNLESVTFTVALSVAPTSNVTIQLTRTGANPTAATLSVSSLTFTPANFSTPRTVTVTGNNDLTTTVNKPYNIHLATTSADPAFNARSADIPLTKLPSLVRVYNLINTDAHVHFYTTNKGERDALVALINNDPAPHHPWVDADPGNTSFALFNRSSAAPNVGYVQRLYNSETSEHYYTLSKGEAEFLASTTRFDPATNTFVPGWAWENRSQSEAVTATNSFQGYMYLPNNPTDTSSNDPIGPAGTLPVFKFYQHVANPLTNRGDHTLTNDPVIYTHLRALEGWEENSMVGFAVRLAPLDTIITPSLGPITSSIVSAAPQTASIRSSVGSAPQVSSQSAAAGPSLAIAPDVRVVALATEDGDDPDQDGTGNTNHANGSVPSSDLDLLWRTAGADLNLLLGD